MLNKLRNFSKGKLAGVLVGIIIIPFVFWGMGSVFSGGNTNSIAKINNHNVSTQDFADFVNNSKISTDVIKENINNNILEELLAQLVSTSLVDIEIDELNVSISDKILVQKLKNQKAFFDNNNNFSRTKYEKFLLESNMSSVKFEQGIRDNELKKKLFIYISGGIKSPYFLLNKTFKDELKEVEVDYVNLNSIYTYLPYSHSDWLGTGIDPQDNSGTNDNYMHIPIVDFNPNYYRAIPLNNLIKQVTGNNHQSETNGIWSKYAGEDVYKYFDNDFTTFSRAYSNQKGAQDYLQNPNNHIGTYWTHGIIIPLNVESGNTEPTGINISPLDKIRLYPTDKNSCPSVFRIYGIKNGAKYIHKHYWQNASTTSSTVGGIQINANDNHYYNVLPVVLDENGNDITNTHLVILYDNYQTDLDTYTGYISIDEADNTFIDRTFNESTGNLQATQGDFETTLFNYALIANRLAF